MRNFVYKCHIVPRQFTQEKSAHVAIRKLTTQINDAFEAKKKYLVEFNENIDQKYSVKKQKQQ